MNRDVLMSILALDAYNRGYSPGINGLHFQQNVTRVGFAVIKADSTQYLLTANARSTGFYGIEYELAGEKIISFRGTDFDVNSSLSAIEILQSELLKDVFNGWSSFLGFGTNSQYGQAELFFKAVTGAEFDGNGGEPLSSMVTVTGHSLGGALAGYVDARAPVNSYLVDPIPYGAAAWGNAIGEALLATLNEFNLVVDDLVEAALGLIMPGGADLWDVFIDRFKQNLEQRAPVLPGISGVYLEGEIASQILELQPTLGEVVASLGLAGTAIAGPIAAALAALGVHQAIMGAINNAVEDRDSLIKQPNHGATDLLAPGPLGLSNLITLHSPGLITISLYGDKQWGTEYSEQNGNGTRWQSVFKYVTAGIFNSPDVANAIGWRGGDQNDPTGLTSAQEQLARIIAYSAINEGDRVFGDTGIRALFDDAGDMGALLDASITPLELIPSAVDEEMKKSFGKLVAEFAGLLATRKVLMEDDDEATDGIFSYRRGTDNNGFLIDLRESTWAKSGDYHESVVKTEIIDGLLDKPENAYVDFNAVGDWYSVYGNPGGNLRAEIDEIILSLTLGKVATARDEAGVALQLGSNADDDQSFGSGTDFVLGGKGHDILRGGGQTDILLGGEGNDELYGDGGVDRLQGGIGEDKLSGGGENDFLVVERDGVRDMLDGGDGIDTVVYSFDLPANVSLQAPTQQGNSGLLDFGIAISAKNLNYGNESFGPDELTSIEKAAIETGSGNDTLFIDSNGVGVRTNDIAYVQLGRGNDDIDLSTWTIDTVVDLATEKLSWKSFGTNGAEVNNAIRVLDAEAVQGGSGNDTLQSRNEAGTSFHLSGGAGNDYIRGLGGNDLLEGGAGNDTIVSLGGDDKIIDVNTIVDHEGKNFIISRGDQDTVIIDGSQSHVELGSNTLVIGADKDDKLSRFGIDLQGGVQQWWNESGTAVWSPYNALLSAFPFIGAQALFSVAAMAADAPYMKFAKYRVDAETGDLLIDLGWGLGGSARIADYHLDLATGRGDAGVTVFRQGSVKQGGNSGVKASNGVEQYFNLALYSGFGYGLPGFDPLVLDLDGNGYDLISREYSQVYFEFDSDGFAENAGWIGGNDAFLVRDTNGNGKIDNITEMFGNRTTSGFTALAALDSNGDGIFDSADTDFASVRLWKDANSNGVTDAGELISLADAGIASISLTAATLTDTDVRGNVVVREGGFTRTDGTTGKVGDIALDVSDTDTRWTGAQTPSQAASVLPQIAGIGELVNLRLAMTGDATLLSMVNAFASNGSAGVAALRDDVADILYRWAGVDGVAATAIGSGGFDTRKLAFLEKYLGAQLMPRGTGGAILTTNLTEVEALWNHEFNQMAFKLIAQGPLATEFAGLTYYESQDLLRAANADTIATILAGFLDDMPADAGAAATYWADWGPLLGAFAGTVMRTSGVEVGRDYFFAELVKAVDSRSLPLDLETLAAGLAIDGLKIGGVSALTRTAGDDGTLVYYSETGSQQFVGGTGQDAYVFGHTIGNAVINDNEARESGDRIRFAFLTPDDVMMARDGNDLLITITATGETVRVLGQFAPVTILGADYLLSSNKGVEDIQFSNGTIYEASDIAIAVGKGTAGNDQLTGTMHSDVLQGLAGNDLLMGGDDADIYVINGGEGQDIIREVQTTPMLRAADLLIFGENVSPDDIEFVREGEGYDDLRIKIGTGGDSVLIEGQFGYSVLGYTGGLSMNSRIEGFSFRHYGAAWSSKEIENLLIERATTAGDDITRGFGNYDHFEISAGNDVLIGMDGGDVYDFGVGAGNDTIDEQARFIDVTVGLGGLANSIENDIVRFKGLTLADVTFKRLSSAPDLTITINATGETLTVKKQFDGFQTGYFGSQWLHRIELFEFDDGSALNWQQVAALTTTGGDGDDQLWGDLYADRMVGGKGNDMLSGGGKGDEYVFNQGDGQDVIFDNNQFLLGDGILAVDNSPDYVTLGAGITPEMVTLSRSGGDLTLNIGSSGDSITLKNQNNLINTGVFGVWGPSRIEEIRFAGGTVWTWQDLNVRWITDNTTSGNDVVTGFALEDIFEASAGNDILSGGDSGDIYRFGLGSGQDIIRESVDNVMYGDTDSVEFAAGIAPEDVQLARNGNNLVISLSDGSSLTIEGQFAYSAWYTWNDIELFKFSNGVTWSAADVRMTLLVATAGNDTIIGFDSDDVLDGGAGNDILRGGNGSDTYHYDAGYGNDVIEENVTNNNVGESDRVVFGPGLLPSDLSVTRSNDDLIFTVIATGETLTVKDHFTFASWFSWKDVERFEFADGTVWTDLDIARRVTGGTPGDDIINGTFRSDTLDGGAGNDTLSGGDGADIYVFGRGYGQDTIHETVTDANLSEADELRFGPGIVESDLTFSRDGSDLVISIDGTSDSVRVVNQWSFASWFTWNDIERFRFDDGSFLTKADVQIKLLASTSGNDNLVGFVDDDRLDGGVGDDILRGGDGADTYVFGIGYGHDQIIESVSDVNLSDNDSIEFGPGIGWDDLTFSRSGNDLTISLASGDTLFIGGQLGTSYDSASFTWNDVENFKFAEGTVKTKADLFTEMLKSTDGDDVLTGFYTSDIISGGLGNDILRGLGGNDTLTGGAGDDILDGDGGNDEFSYALGDGSDIIDDQEGQNILQLGAGIGPADIKLSTTALNPNDIVIRFSGTNGSVVLKNQITASSSQGIASVRFADGSTWNRATLLAEFFSRQAGDGDDYIGGDNNSNSLNGGAGNDEIRALGGNDTIRGGVGDDLLDGANGDDELHGDGGNDRLLGGSGNDRYHYDIGDGSDVIADNGSDTIDALVFGVGIAPADVLLEPDPTNSANMIIRFAISSETILIEQQWNGNKGVERVEFADGSVWNAVEIANRFAVGSARAGDDILDGTSGNDIIAGGAGNDTIRGLAGNDTIIGGTGNDTLQGSFGADTYIYNLGDGEDVIYDGNLNSDSSVTDTLKFGAGITASMLRFIVPADTNDVRIEFIGQSGSILLDNQQYSDVGIEQIIFGDGTIWNHAQFLAQVVLSQQSAGNDTIYGSAYADNLDGGAGDDAIYAGGGNDTIIGGTGNDILQGSTGADTYVYNIGDGNDVIYDGNLNSDSSVTDTLKFGAGITANMLKFIVPTDVNDVRIEFVGQSGSILLDNQQYSDVGIEQVLFDDGTSWTHAQFLAQVVLSQQSAGNDVITGSAYADSVDGGAGDDRINAGGGNDTIIGGLGNDDLRGGTGADTYLYNLGDGDDLIYDGNLDYDTSATDTLKFGAGITASMLKFIVPTDTNDIRIEFVGQSGSILLDGQHFSDVGIEQVIFDDGTTWNHTQFMAQFVAGQQSSGNDVIYGSAFADNVDGGAGDDKIFAAGGNDIIIGGAGNDEINGGAGTDIAVLSGLSATYSMITSGGFLHVTDNAPSVDGDDGTDKLKTVEKLRFSNGQEIGITSPIILDLDGNGVTTVSAYVGRARYDMDGDGVADITSWMGHGEGMLFLDHDANGTLSNAGEFSFVNDVEGAASDLVGLRAFDSNGDGTLSSGDSRFADFRIWRDDNGDGAVQDDEIMTLEEAGVASLKLIGQAVEGNTALGDVAVLNTGSYTRTDGQIAQFIDAALTYFSGTSSNNVPAAAKQQDNPLSRRLLNAIDWNDRRILRRAIDVDWQSGRDPGADWPQLGDHKMWSGPEIVAIDNPAHSATLEPSVSTPASSIDRQLSMMVQEMNVFGAKSAGEGLGPWQRENARPIEFFA